MDSWWDSGEQQDWAAQGHSDEIDFDEALGEVVANEPLGEEPGVTRHLVPADVPRPGEQGLLDSLWSEFDP
eukprot:1552360-Pyramimonas_sp.AAC.1